MKHKQFHIGLIFMIVDLSTAACASDSNKVLKFVSFAMLEIFIPTAFDYLYLLNVSR